MHLLTIDTSEAEPSPLVSPTRQVFFLLGLMLTTAEPENPTEFGPYEWEQSVRLLNAIVNTYSLMFWPTPEELPALTDAWRETREVAMSAFLHYFNTTILATVEQCRERIQEYLVPFDADFEAAFGLSAKEALQVADWMGQHLQRCIDELQEAETEEKKARIALLDLALKEGWDRDRMRREAQGESYRPQFEKMMAGLQSLLRISIKALQDQFGDRIAESYWKLFVAHRGGVEGFTYFTERNTAEEKPLIEVCDGVALCPLANALYWAILRTGELELSSGERKESFLKNRDKTLEAKVEGITRRFFGGAADFFPHVFETNTQQFEHDLIIRWDRYLFVVEAKASPPVEPFRDPDKAFTRIQRAFQSDRGIQHAYDQANRIRSRIISGEPIELFDGDGNLAACLSPKDIDCTYCVCVTRDDFGPLAADLSLLLAKEKTDPYPWAVNILDLESILDAWGYFGWNPSRLCEYLNDRILLNGKLFASDELEIAGVFIHHGGLAHLVNADADRIQLTPQYSDVFDRIYQARHGGEQVVYAPTEPFMGDMREMLAQMMGQVTAAPPSAITLSAAKQGRNERCACGSGKKYKHCCGRNR